MVGASLRGMPAAYYVSIQLDLDVSCDGWSDLELCDTEASSSADSTVVLEGRAANDRPQLVDRTRCDLSDLGGTRIATGLLLAGLWDSVSGLCC